MKQTKIISQFTEQAKTLGFIAIGSPQPPRPAHFDPFRSRLADRKHGDMTWLERNPEVREDPSKLLEGCQTIISLAYPYPNARHETEDGYWVARYADPSREDYHFRLKKLGEDLSEWIQKDYPGSRAMVCVDSSPILENKHRMAMRAWLHWKEHLAGDSGLWLLLLSCGNTDYRTPAIPCYRAYARFVWHQGESLTSRQGIRTP